MMMMRSTWRHRRDCGQRCG